MVVRAQPLSGGRSALRIEAGGGAVTEPALRQRLAATLSRRLRPRNPMDRRSVALASSCAVSRHAPDGSRSGPAGTCFGIEPKASGAPRVHVFDAAPPRTYARCTARARHAMTA